MDTRAAPQADAAGPGGVDRGETARSRIIVIAASAGGLAALRAVIEALPRDFGAALLVLQHLAQGSPGLLAGLLAMVSKLPVETAREGVRPMPGRIYVAPPGKHLVIGTDETLRFEFSHPTHFVRPSADKLFGSAANAYGARTIGVVLTGRGEDGADGARAIKAAGGIVVCQDEASSVAFGMPGAAIADGDADYVVALDEVAPLLVRLAGHEAAA